MQGDTITMIAYGIRILPLIKNLKQDIPDITQPWCYDDDGALCTFVRLETYFDFLKLQGPGQGYHTNPTKSILIVQLKNLQVGKVFRARHGFSVCMSACYLGGYIGDNKSKLISTRSAKPWGIIPRRVMPQWYVQSNQNGYFFNASPGTQETHSREWRR